MSTETQTAASQNKDPQSTSSVIETRVEETMRAIALLIDHGEEAVNQQGTAEGTSTWGAIPTNDKGDGVELFTGTDETVGVPVLANIYNQLGATEARISAVPTVYDATAEQRA